MSPKFIAMLQRMRNLCGYAMIITSGFRCNNWNMKVGGAERSYHLTGEAADIAVASSEGRFFMLKAAMEVGFFGVGIDGAFIHVDMRGETKAKLWLY